MHTHTIYTHLQPTTQHCDRVERVAPPANHGGAGRGHALAGSLFGAALRHSYVYTYVYIHMRACVSLCIYTPHTANPTQQHIKKNSWKATKVLFEPMSRWIPYITPKKHMYINYTPTRINTPPTQHNTTINTQKNPTSLLLDPQRHLLRLPAPRLQLQRIDREPRGWVGALMISHICVCICDMCVNGSSPTHVECPHVYEYVGVDV